MRNRIARWARILVLALTPGLVAGLGLVDVMSASAASAAPNTTVAVRVSAAPSSALLADVSAALPLAAVAKSKHCGIKAAWTSISYKAKPYLKATFYGRAVDGGKKGQWCFTSKTYKARPHDKQTIKVVMLDRDIVKSSTGRLVEVKVTVGPATCVLVKIKYVFGKGSSYRKVVLDPIPACSSYAA